MERQTPGHYRALFYLHQKAIGRQESTQKLPFSLTNWWGEPPPWRNPKCTDSLCASLGTAQLGSPADNLDHQQNPHVRHTRCANLNVKAVLFCTLLLLGPDGTCPDNDSSSLLQNRSLTRSKVKPDLCSSKVSCLLSCSIFQHHTSLAVFWVIEKFHLMHWAWDFEILIEFSPELLFPYGCQLERKMAVWCGVHLLWRLISYPSWVPSQAMTIAFPWGHSSLLTPLGRQFLTNVLHPVM